MLAAWIVACVLVLSRHYACTKDISVGHPMLVCQVFRVPVHHFVLYLQVAGACLLGQAVAWLRPPRALLGAMLIAGLVAFWLRPYDRLARASEPPIDLAGDQWIRHHTAPSAVFVTALPTDRDADFDPAGFAVMAAGRQLLGAHTLFSNPYLPWAPREALRQQTLGWIEGHGRPSRCGPDIWAIVPRDVVLAPARTHPVFLTQFHRIANLDPAACQD